MTTNMVGKLEKNRLLAIDPGLNSMGWAYWNRLPNVLPTEVGLLHAPRKMSLTERALWLAWRLDEYLDLCRGAGIHVVCEYPAYHGPTAMRGWVTGDLQKLTFLVGVLAGYFESSEFEPVTPNTWKGQLPKDVVIRRLQKKFGPGATQEWEKDVWDAVGIGLWRLGQF